MLNYIKLLFEWYQIQSSNHLFVLFHSVCDYLFVCLFVCFWCVFDVKPAVFWTGTVVFKHWLRKSLNSYERGFLICYRICFEWYQIHNYNNLFVCFSLFAIVCLFICLFIYEVYLMSKPRFFNRYSRFQTLIKKPP